jgi:long-chain acyl-CoA synthetase
MYPAPHAEQHPDKPAYIMAATGEVVTYRELNDRSNQFANLLADHGLGFGDHVAVFMENNPRYLEVTWGAQRSGILYTAINWHFNAEEVAYILDDCDAELVVVDTATADVAAELPALCPRVKTWLVVGAPATSPFERYEDAIASYPTTPRADETEGSPMLYSSGTTGRPKGIKYKLTPQPMGTTPTQLLMLTHLFGFMEDSVYLSPAPLYHSAPLFYCMSVIRLGATVIVMEHFDPERALALIEQYHVTHSQWVPTMFVRMLKLPPEVRTRYDLSTHTSAIHAAAPCPVEIKKQMIEWWGPIVDEYYSSTEGMGATAIKADDWLQHPGSVGRSLMGPIHIVDENGDDLPTGEVGVVYFERPGDDRPRLQFEYHKDQAKTAEAHDTHGWASVGDMGYLDDDGYLFLTDRKSFMIVSGGVNIYPQECENLLITHPKVFDVAVFGVPNEEMGEEVKAVVQPVDWDAAGPDLERELLAFCREHLAHYKCPRSIDFDPELPRQPTGKLYKRLIRDRYWGDHTSRIV